MISTLRSATAGPLLLRFAILVSAAVATLLAVPRFPWLVVLAVVPAILVRRTVPDVYLGAILFAWILSTHSHGTPADWRVCVLALALYYLHAAAALSAVMPIDATIAAGTFRPWLARIGTVTVVTVALAAMVAALQAVATGERPVVAATYAGLLVLIGIVVFLVRLGGRS
jgi:hypothetical protein